MGKIVDRLLRIELPPGQSAFLWGPWKVGKSYWIDHHLSKAVVLDLLKTDIFAEYAARPALLRERHLNHPGPLVIDEIQKIPALLSRKGSSRVHEGDLRALNDLKEDGPVKHCVMVCLEKEPRRVAGIEILPWRTSLDRLWAGSYI